MKDVIFFHIKHMRVRLTNSKDLDKNDLFPKLEKRMSVCIS